MPPFSLQNKTAIVTGGARGIGKAICEVFTKAGAAVHILDVIDEEGTALASEWKDLHYHHCDLTRREDVWKVVEKLGDGGAIDILVNNAGIAFVGNILNTPAEDFARIMAVNVNGVYHCMQACIPHMIKNGGGAIVNIASTIATKAIHARFAYMASKGAVLSMTYSVALDFIQYGIRCNAISPGRVHTPFVDGFIEKNYPGREKEMHKQLSEDHPIGRMARPEEIAHMALYLCSDEAAYVTGSNQLIDGGFSNLKAT